DPHSGQVDFTVAEVGTDRLVWGGHGPSRSYSTELAKVFDADLTQAQRERYSVATCGDSPSRFSARKVTSSEISPSDLASTAIYANLNDRLVCHLLAGFTRTFTSEIAIIVRSPRPV